MRRVLHLIGGLVIGVGWFVFVWPSTTTVVLTLLFLPIWLGQLVLSYLLLRTKLLGVLGPISVTSASLWFFVWFWTSESSTAGIGLFTYPMILISGVAVAAVADAIYRNRKQA